MEVRFSNLLKRSDLLKKDESFIESIRKQYSSKGRISKRQRSYFESLEVKYAKLTTGGSLGDKKLGTRLASIQKTVDSNTWDAGFIESVTKQNNLGHRISEKQLFIVSKIEARNSSANKAAARKWLADYSDYHKKVAKHCAEYYSNTPYFNDLAVKVLEDPEFKLTQKQWVTMCENKYAKKIISNIEDMPKYSIDTVVELRKTSDFYKYGNSRRGRPAFVIKTDAAPPRSINGGRFYSVLFAGEAAPTILMEKDIKLSKMK